MSDLVGMNFVRLKGRIKNPLTKTVGQYNSTVFNASLAIPAPSPQTGFQYIKISSFSRAEELAGLEPEAFVELEGHIEERSFSGSCRHCGGYERKYWTEVVVDNFVVLN